jgi:uncharacterized protein (TIGR03084 family)
MSERMPQATDFLEECAALHDVLQTLPEGDFARTTQFKDWTLDAILRHLHVWNDAAAIAFAWLDRQAFMDFRAALEAHMTRGGLRAFEQARLGPAMQGQRLLAAWWEGCGRVAAAYRDADPRARVPWVGPDMSVTSAITARQMETWAHGQAIFDLLGVQRVDGDRVRNVAHLGVATFGWSFANRGLPVPAATVHVRLQAPSGAVWEWNAGASGNFVAGAATEFCQVVAQTRNVADTSLEIRGDLALHWMMIAQCFAGPPEDPPAPGTRFRVGERENRP